MAQDGNGGCLAGFERSQMREWFELAGLVNVVVDCTGQSCQSDCKSGEGRTCDISIFVAGRDEARQRTRICASQLRRPSAGSGLRAVAAIRAAGAPGVVSLDELSARWPGTAGTPRLRKPRIPAEAAEISPGLRQPDRHGACSPARPCWISARAEESMCSWRPGGSAQAVLSTASI